jgi:F-type H+-transporting ATPase subunit b
MMLLSAAKPSLIDINFGLMFWTIVSFLIVLVVLKKFALGPIQATLDERRKTIASDLDNAQSAREEAQAALEEYRTALAESRKEAVRIVEEARKAADERRARDLAEIESEKARQLERAKEEIAAEVRSALQTIKMQIAELSVITTEKLVRSKLDEAEQKRLIEDALAGVDLSAFASLEPKE